MIILLKDPGVFCLSCANKSRQCIVLSSPTKNAWHNKKSDLKFQKVRKITILQVKKYSNMTIELPSGHHGDKFILIDKDKIIWANFYNTNIIYFANGYLEVINSRFSLYGEQVTMYFFIWTDLDW